jgi:CBS domain-containing protein
MPVVSNHMSTDLLTVEPDVRLPEAARRMAQRGVGAVLVLEGERLAGILTERDLLKAVAKGFTNEARVSEWMTRQPETVEPDETTDQAASLMIHGGFRHLPVVEGGRAIGILSIRDLMRVALHDSAPRGV